MNKRVLTVAAVLLIAVIVVLFVKTQNQQVEKADSITIGAILPLTGSAAPYGQNAQRGIDLAVSEINAGDGISGKKVIVLYEDSKTEPKEAVAALQKLFNSNGVRYVIGDINSTGLLAMAPIAERNKILLLSPGASNPKVSDAGDYIFRNWHSDALEGQVDAEYAFLSMKWKTAAVLYVNAAYGAGLAETFKKVFEKQGGRVVAYEAYAQDATNMREQISKIIAVQPDGLYLPGWPKEMSVALKQLKELGSNIPVLSAQGFDDPSILRLAGDAAEGVIFSVPQQPDPNDETVKSFLEKYKTTYNREPGVCSASGYDALMIYAEAINEVGDDPENVQGFMAELKGFSGADGPVSFDKYGDLLKPFVFKKVYKGKFEQLK